MDTIYKRIIIDAISPYLETNDSIVLHGARQVGKTSILYYLQRQLNSQGEQTYFMDLEDSRFARTLDAGVETFLQHLREEGLLPASGRLFVFIDEIQHLVDPSAFLKLMADHHKGIKLIVSGSSSFAIKSKFRDSLVGRTVNFEIFPLSFREFLIFRSVAFEPGLNFTIQKIEELKTLFREYALYGGYPKIVLTPENAKKEKYLQQIVDTYIRKDIRDLADIRDVDKFNHLVEALAGQSGQILNVAELSNTSKIARQTIERYLFILENTYILKLVRPYHRNIRSELFKLPKVFFYDTGLMQMLWLKGLQKELVGNVFETAVFSELVKWFSPESVFYWRTKDKKEIDFILRFKNQAIPVEAKVNFGRTLSSALNYFSTRYETDDYRVVGLNGERRDRRHIYPWSLASLSNPTVKA